MIGKFITTSLLAASLFTLGLVGLTNALSALETQIQEKYGAFPEGAEGFDKYCLLRFIVEEEYLKYKNGFGSYSESDSRKMGADQDVIDKIIMEKRTPKMYCPVICKHLAEPNIHDSEDKEDASPRSESQGYDMVDDIKELLEQRLPEYSKCASLTYAIGQAPGFEHHGF